MRSGEFSDLAKLPLLSPEEEEEEGIVKVLTDVKEFPGFRAGVRGNIGARWAGSAVEMGAETVSPKPVPGVLTGGK